MVTHLMGADLNNIIRTQRLSDDHVQFLVYQIVRGMKYVHSAGIIHRYNQGFLDTSFLRMILGISNLPTLLSMRIVS